VKWNLPKTQVQALDVGTICIFHTREGVAVDIAPLWHTHIGERIAEGYGEAEAYPFSELSDEILISETEGASALHGHAAPGGVATTHILSDILKRALLDQVRQCGVDRAKQESRIRNATTVGRLGMMFWESGGDIEAFARNLLAVKEEEKRAECLNALFGINLAGAPDAEDGEDPEDRMQRLCEYVVERIKIYLHDTIAAGTKIGTGGILTVAEASAEDLFNAYVPAFLEQAKYDLRPRQTGGGTHA
jgi:hypothetical protein